MPRWPRPRQPPPTPTRPQIRSCPSRKNKHRNRSMHRATPIMTSFRSFVAGGARALITSVDDSKLMQEMTGSFMKGESRKGVESPQNYGFTSAVMDGDKGSDGQVSSGPEGFMTFCGGNRSLPVCMVMDDRRHRLKELDKGDVAMFRTKDDQLQLHLSDDGGFWSGRDDKKLRLQLVAKDQQQQGQGQSGASARDGSSGGTAAPATATGRRRARSRRGRRRSARRTRVSISK